MPNQRFSLRFAAIRPLLIALLAVSAACAQSLHFGVMGDPGTGKRGQVDVARQMEKFAAEKKWEFVLSLGDNVYQTGNPNKFASRFKNVYANLVKNGTAIHATLGNHDRRTANGSLQLKDPFFGYVDQQDEYTFEAGPVVEGKRMARFLTINSEAWIDELMGRRQQPGLQERLKRLQDWLAISDRYHWNILFIHHPLYSYLRSGFFVRGHGSSAELRDFLESKIQGRIDVVFAGHDHFYQKIKPQAGIHHIVSGSAGQIRRGAAYEHPQVEKTAEKLHFLTVEVDKDSLQYRAIDDRGEEIDSRTLKRGKKEFIRSGAAQ